MRIQPVKTALHIMSDGTYPIGMICNEIEIKNLIEVFNVAATILNEQPVPTHETRDGKSVLNGLAASFNEYLFNKSNLPVIELPTEVTADFQIIPIEACNILLEFQPLNNVSTEVLWFSWDEMYVINNSLTMAKSLSRNENYSSNIVDIVNSFSSFVINNDPLNK